METHAAQSVLSAMDVHRAAAPGEGRINVLFLTIDITIGGAERLVLDLARSLDRQVFSPSVGWFSHEEPPREFQDLRVPLFPIRKRPGFDVAAMRRLGRIVREHGIDVVNAHHFMSCFYAFHAARIANRTGLVYMEHSEADVLRAAGPWRMLGAGLLRSCDNVVGVSQGVSAALESHFRLGAGRVQTIQNGVDLGLFDEAKGKRMEVRRGLGLAPDDVVIGHVANFRRNKNHLFLVRAFRDAFGGRPDVKLLLVGQGFPGDSENSEPEVAAWVRANGLEPSVRLLGYRADVHELLQAMDVFSLVSYKEGLPLSVIEAMASGLPVVATNIEGLRPVVQPETTGLLVEPDDVPGLARALSRLAADPALRRRLGESAREQARRQVLVREMPSGDEQILAASAVHHVRPRSTEPA